MNNDNNKKDNTQAIPVGWTIAIIGLSVIGFFFMCKDIKSALDQKDQCILCDRDAVDGELYCYYHQTHKYSFSNSRNTGTSSSTKRTTQSTGKSSGSTSSLNKTSKKKNSYSMPKVDPSDHDIDMYYEDYKEEFEDEDDAWDDFEDNEEYWDEY